MNGIKSTAAVASVAMLAAGCGSVHTTTTTSGRPSQDAVSTAFRFSQCMRRHGLPQFPDPKVTNTNGQHGIVIHVPSGLAPAKLTSAQHACRGILPQPSKTDLAAQAQRQRVHTRDILAFARCLRNHGVTGFPDPNAQGELTPQMITAAGVDLHAPSVRSAGLACVAASKGAVTRAAVEQATG